MAQWGAPAVLAAAVVAAVALQGHLPPRDPPSSGDGSDGNPFSALVVVAVLGATLIVVGVAVISRAHRGARVSPPARPLPGGDAGADGRPSWRFWLATVLLVGVLGLGAAVLDGFLGRADEVSAAWLSTDDASVQADAGPAGPDGGPVATDPGADDAGLLGFLGAVTAGFAALAVLAAVGTRRRGLVAGRRRPAHAAPYRAAATADAAALTHVRAAMEVGRREVADGSHAPREAVIACYAAMEHGLAGVRGAEPEAPDTPTEVLTRAVRAGALRPEGAAALVDLFAEARFSSHDMTERHRARAAAVLDEVLSDLWGVR